MTPKHAHILSYVLGQPAFKMPNQESDWIHYNNINKSC